MTDFDPEKFELRKWLDEVERLVRLILYKLEEAKWPEQKPEK